MKGSFTWSWRNPPSELLTAQRREAPRGMDLESFLILSLRSFPSLAAPSLSVTLMVFSAMLKTRQEHNLTV